MKVRRRWLAVAAALGLILGAAPQVLASDNTLTLQPGDTIDVVCNGKTLSTHKIDSVTAHDECIPNKPPKTTTTAGPTTTHAPTTTAAPTTTGSTTSTTSTSTTSTTSTTQPSGGTVPAQVLDLSHWKITLPTGAPTEVLQPQLATYSDTNFRVEGGKVVFTARVDGAHTSGSDYPRSELREMTGSDGRSLASWSNASGTHTMTVTEAITHAPAVKQHVVAAQVHGSSDDLFKIRYEGSGNGSLQPLFVEDSGGASLFVLDPHYVIGTVFTVKIVGHDGVFDIYYNGPKVFTYTKSASGLYFKAGSYVQSNVSKGDAPSDYGQVVISALTVTHA